MSFESLKAVKRIVRDMDRIYRKRKKKSPK